MGRKLVAKWTVERSEDVREALRWPDDVPIPKWMRTDFLWLLLFDLERTVRVELKRTPKE